MYSGRGRQSSKITDQSVLVMAKIDVTLLFIVKYRLTKVWTIEFAD